MRVSYNWLQNFFDSKLPSPAEVEQALIFHSFEVEGTEERKGDFLLEVKVLPDRAPDCLSHYGIAKEVGAIFKLPIKSLEKILNEVEGKEILGHSFLPEVPKLEVKVEDPHLGRRYVGRIIQKAEIKESPLWLKEKLEALDQRSINCVVDAANFVMFDLGQPLHAFDADKVKGKITVRAARTGEKMITLDDKELNLTEEMLVIADEEGVLALAGIKGGKRAEVTKETKNLILESANFDPATIRRTSTKVAVRTDASKRFENNLSPVVAGYAMEKFTNLLSVLAFGEETKIGEVTDVYELRAEERMVELHWPEVEARLGVKIELEEGKEILERLGIEVVEKSDHLRLVPPAERMDLVLSENIIEEIGRIYGYEKVPAILPQTLERNEIGSAEKAFRLKNAARKKMAENGYSEIYGYSFVSEGEVEMANPLSADKAYLRKELKTFIAGKIRANLEQILFENDALKLFEFGKIFKAPEVEESHLALLMASKKKIKGFDYKSELRKMVGELALEFEITNWEEGIVIEEDLELPAPAAGAYLELDWSKISTQAKIQNPDFDLSKWEERKVNYERISPYPRIIRDVSLFVPEGTDEEKVALLIRNSAGEWLSEGPIIFDRFTKEGRTSLAFRMAFQADDKTLSDEEANSFLDKVIAALEGESFEVRK